MKCVVSAGNGMAEQAVARHLGEAVSSLVQQNCQQVAACLRGWGSLEVGHQLGDASKVSDCLLVQLQPCSTFRTTPPSVFCKLTQLFVTRSSKVVGPNKAILLNEVIVIAMMISCKLPDNQERVAGPAKRS